MQAIHNRCLTSRYIVYKAIKSDLHTNFRNKYLLVWEKREAIHFISSFSIKLHWIYILLYLEIKQLKIFLCLSTLPRRHIGIMYTELYMLLILMEICGQLQTWPPYSMERVPIIHWTEGWMGLRADLDSSGKSKQFSLSKRLVYSRASLDVVTVNIHASTRNLTQVIQSTASQING